ncbi:DNA polymerase II large subunit [Candidatus Woesearchaeota archaeon]|nr:DNA polymerase II large subunit [Candidatus Woesearchaeota archaeon]
MESYFNSMQKELDRAYASASRARKKGYDPEEGVDIPLARNMAERVEGLISAVAPDILGKGIPQRIQQLEKKYGALAWQVALIIAEEVAREKFCKFKNLKEAMEVGIRTGFAYHTVGVVAAPLEGFVELRIKKRRDGKEYIAASFAGPIRGAGGTAAGVCLIITDYIRKKMGFDKYDPDESEIHRFITELSDYHERVTNLQYKPTDQEVRYLVQNLPIEIDGDPSEKIEVSNYKDLSRVATNKIRSGVCLVLSMLALKAPKLWKEMKAWGKSFDLDWSFLSTYISMKKEKSKKVKGLSPDFTFISDLVAGRPVLTYPLRSGGFRLRYGKTRMSGYSAAGIHPATMAVLDKYIATGTQLKMERPGKAAAITPADSIDGPIVKLENGNVIRLETEADAKRHLAEIQEILFLGDILISYGDFFDRAQSLVPAGYCEEWHVQEIEKATVNLFGNLDMDKLSEHADIPAEEVASIIKNPFLAKPTIELSIKLSLKLGIPLHPYYTFYWSTLSSQELLEMAEWLSSGSIKREEQTKIILPISKCKRYLELIGAPHSVVSNQNIVISGADADSIIATLDLENFSITKFVELCETQSSSVDIINSASQIKIRDKAGTFIGARMGRPEKAKMRAMTGSPHALFPVGNEGGRLRSLQSSMESGNIYADFSSFYCENCSRDTIYPVCVACDKKTKKVFFCNTCGRTEKMECSHGETRQYSKTKINVSEYLESALRKLKTKTYPDLIKGVKGTSNKNHTTENLSKGILRAIHELCVNKDGTTRYDMTELPITHFRPSEVRTPVMTLIELGYDKDVSGQPLTSSHQLLELKPQDLILPAGFGDESADSVLYRASKFVDDELTLLYESKPYYNLKSKEGLVGQLVIGLAPHISAGIVGRIIGFSATQTFLAHPLFHAAMRRDTDGDEACVILLMDALLNFSRQFLPDTRGAKTMDSPLVLTAKLVPAEVDDMVHRFDVAWRYPLEFYEATLLQKMPGEIYIELLGSRLGTPLQYEKIGFTHDVHDINSGNTYSAYKTLPSMEEKLKGQMVLAEKIRAVDAQDVAKMVIEKHLIRDIKGNLRKFSTQQFRCVKCNKKYRRPPLIGQCECNGKLIFTVSEGAIIKYLGPAISLADKYDVSPYLKQTLELTRKRVEEVFGRDKEKQEGLGKWFG